MQAGESELSQPVERCVLHGEFLQTAETAESERLDVTDDVAIQIQFTKRFVALKSVRFQMSDVVFSQRKVFHSRRQIVRYLIQSSAITQDLFNQMFRIIQR